MFVPLSLFYLFLLTNAKRFTIKKISELRSHSVEKTFEKMQKISLYWFAA